MRTQSTAAAAMNELAQTITKELHDCAFGTEFVVFVADAAQRTALATALNGGEPTDSQMFSIADGSRQVNTVRILLTDQTPGVSSTVYFVPDPCPASVQENYVEPARGAAGTRFVSYAAN